MTNNIVERLRYQADEARKNYPEVFRISEEIAYEAADRIEKLEAALQAVIRYAGNAGDDYLADQARKALEGKDD